MGLSSNILWHQTDKKGFFSILKEKRLRYGYSREYVFGKGKDSELAIPMVSVCDLPFSEMDSYLGKYGNYAVGLSSNWGRRNGLNPVWYCHYSSSIFTQLTSHYLATQSQDERQTLFDVLSYVKFVEGKLIKKNYRKYRFYDEREYRHCPTLKELKEGGFKPFLSIAEYEEYKKKHLSRSSMDIGIPFEWSDVKYLVVYSDNNIDEVRKKLKTRGCDNPHIGIYTNDQVRQDFIGIKHDELLVKESEDPIMDLVTGRKSVVELMFPAGKVAEPHNNLTFNNLTPFRNPNRSTAAQQAQIWTSLDTFATPLPDILKT